MGLHRRLDACIILPDLVYETRHQEKKSCLLRSTPVKDTKICPMLPLPLSKKKKNQLAV